MAANSMQELYVEQLQNLYSAKQQIIEALPKMMEAAQSEELHNALVEHLEIARTQADRIEKICQELGEDPDHEKCKGMAGVIQEGNDLVTRVSKDIRDAAIIAAAQRMEHYEMAGYGTARTYAVLLRYNQAADMLEQSLTEEKEADTTLSELAESVNLDAMQQEESPAGRSNKGSKESQKGNDPAKPKGKRAA